MRRLERLHRPAHLGVIQRADVEVEILEGLGAHLRHLGHRGRGPAQDDPARLVDADVAMDLVPDALFVEFLLVHGHVGKLRDVGVAPEADVAGDALHLLLFDLGDEVPLFGRAGVHQGAVDFVGLEQHDGPAARGAADADDLLGEIVGNVDGFDEHVLAGLDGQE